MSNPNTPEAKAIFPQWGRYGVRVEYKPPTEQFRNPKILISEVAKKQPNRDGMVDRNPERDWVFFLRPLNEAQAQRGSYNPHVSLPLDCLPSFIAALVDVYNAVAPGGEGISHDAQDIRDTYAAQHERAEVERASYGFGELNDRREAAPAPASKPPDVWDYLAKARDEVRKKEAEKLAVDPEFPDENTGGTGGEDEGVPF